MKRLRNRQLRASRGVLAVTGLILAGIAVLGLLLSTNIVDGYGSWFEADAPVLNPSARQSLDANVLLAQGVAAAAGLLLIAIGVVWLRAQIPPIRHQEDNRFDNPDTDVVGTNTITGSALAHALETDLQRSDVIDRARAEFRTDDNLLRLRLDIDDTASIDEILDTVVDPAVDRITIVAELGTKPTLQIDLRPLAVTTARVH